MFLEREKQTEEEEEGNAPKWEATCSSLAVELIPPHESMHTGQQDTLVPLITPARPKHRFEPEIKFHISSLAPLDLLQEEGEKCESKGTHTELSTWPKAATTSPCSSAQSTSSPSPPCPTISGSESDEGEPPSKCAWMWCLSTQGEWRKASQRQGLLAVSQRRTRKEGGDARKGSVVCMNALLADGTALAHGRRSSW